MAKKHKTASKDSKEAKKEVSHTKKKESITWLWPVVCIILVALLVASIITSGFNIGSSGSFKALSKGAIELKTQDYVTKLLEAQGAQQVVVAKVVNESDGFYTVSLDVGGQKFESYVSKDGKFLFPSGINLDQKIPTASEQAQAAAADIPKSDKPVVEVFVMSHCPYGTQIEKGMIPVMKLLKDKADIQIKFVGYAMHGLKEITEELTQVCIMQTYPTKYVSYLECFLNASDTTGCMAKEGITESSLSSCKADMETKYKVMEDYNDPNKTNWMGSYPPFNVYAEENAAYSVQGSPTLIINGVQADVARDAQSLLTAICNTFNTAPLECQTDMTAYGNPAAGFGWTNQGAAASTGGGCGG